MNGEQSGAVEACWAHNPEVRRSKLRSAKFFSLHLVMMHVWLMRNIWYLFFSTVRMAKWSKAPDSCEMLHRCAVLCVLVHNCGRGFVSHFWHIFALLLSQCVRLLNCYLWKLSENFKLCLNMSYYFSLNKFAFMSYFFFALITSFVDCLPNLIWNAFL